MPVELPSAPLPQITPTQVAEATVQALLDKQAAESEARLKEAFDIQDPGQKKAEAPVPQSAPAPTTGQGPSLIPGAVADGLTEAILDRAAAVGINSERAKALGADGIRDILSRLPTIRETPPPPQYKYDPETGKKLVPDPEDDLPELTEPETELLDETSGEKVKGRFDPALTKVVNAQRQALKETREKLDRIEREREAAQAQAVERKNSRDFAEMEKCFAEDAAMKDVFGDGPAHRLIGTAAHENRAKLARAADKLVEAGVAATVPESYEMAKRALYGDRVTAQARTQAQQQIYDRARNAQGQFVSKPSATERSDDLPKGPARALRTLERMLREQGAPA